MADPSVLDYISTLEWPVIASAALLYWRKPISGILKRISESKRGSAKVGPASFEWDDTLQVVNAVLTEAETKPELGPPTASVPPSEPSEDPKLEPTGEPGSESEPPDVTLPGDGQLEKRILTPNEALNRRRQALRELGSVTPWRLASETPYGVSPDSAWGRVMSLVKISPAAAVAMAFTEVEGEIRRDADLRGIQAARPLSIRTLMRQIELPEEIVEAVNGLSRLRNAVAHERAQPTAAEALDYIGSARRVYDWISRHTYPVDTTVPGAPGDRPSEPT